MKKIVSVENIVSGKTFEAIFIDEEIEMVAWIAKQEAKTLNGRGWGWGERRMPKASCPAELLILIVEEYENEAEVWARLKPEYEITISDVTVEHEAELSAIEERKNKMKDKTLNVKDRLEALIEHLGLDI